MPINIDQALGIHAQALMLRSQRAQVLAANLANADTPHYQARDIDFKSVLSAAQQNTASETLPLEATSVAHLSTSGQDTGTGYELKYRQPTQSAIDGNTVDTQKEHAEFMQNALQYQASLTFLSARLHTLLSAIRGD
jgi:flagellar basal-body rod protein FlgB